jgi:hypothetical protein
MAKTTTGPDVSAKTLEALYEKKQPKWSSGALKNRGRWMSREKKRLLKEWKGKQDAPAK